MQRLCRIRPDDRAASAVEFALVLPLLLVFIFGIIDVGRFLWTLNRAEKAAQMGVRYAVVSDPVAEVLNTDFVGDYSIPGGDVVPQSVFTRATCTNTGNCTVVGTASGDSGRNTDAFDDVVNWMKRFDSAIEPANVRIIYENVGLGYSGDPTAPDVAPLTTVELVGLSFRPAILLGFDITLPTISASLTLEDGECSTTGDCGSSN